MGPVLDQVSVEYAGRLTVGKVNVDVQPELAARFGVRGIPTLVMFKDGQAVSQVVGAVPKTELTRWIDSIQIGQA
jgi:thioredoxin 1